MWMWNGVIYICDSVTAMASMGLELIPGWAWPDDG